MILNIPATIHFGYTYTDPVNLEPDSTSSTDIVILKYRFYHNAKADIDINIKRFRIGISMNYFSHIINIDKAFEDTIRLPNGTPIIQNGKPLMVLPGLPEYRAKHNTGEIVFDMRFAFQVSKKSKISIVIKNLFNREYMIRPGDVKAPRSFAFQYYLKV